MDPSFLFLGDFSITRTERNNEYAQKGAKKSALFLLESPSQIDNHVERCQAESDHLVEILLLLASHGYRTEVLLLRA